MFAALMMGHHFSISACWKAPSASGVICSRSKISKPRSANFWRTVRSVDAFRARGLKPPRTTVICHSMHMRDKLLATGRFLSMLSSYTLMLPRRNPSLKALPVELDNARGTIAIIILKNRTLSPLAELFIKTARAIVKPLARAR
jgi:DNA-binding transcriptional LysR family regulator